MAAGMTKTQLVRYMAEKKLETNNKTAATFLETLAECAIKETKKNGGGGGGEGGGGGACS